MTKPIHIILSVDEEQGTVDCANCGVVPYALAWTKNGKTRPQCIVQRKEKSRRDGAKYPHQYQYKAHRKILKDRVDLGLCERCAFVAEDTSQLDVDHKLAKKFGGTDTADNLWVICANCHRLKTAMERKPDFDLEKFVSGA